MPDCALLQIFLTALIRSRGHVKTTVLVKDCMDLGTYFWGASSMNTAGNGAGAWRNDQSESPQTAIAIGANFPKCERGVSFDHLLNERDDQRNRIAFQTAADTEEPELFPVSLRMCHLSQQLF